MTAAHASTTDDIRLQFPALERTHDRHPVEAQGLVRAGCACYTTEQEVDRLIKGVEALAL